MLTCSPQLYAYFFQNSCNISWISTIRHGSKWYAICDRLVMPSEYLMMCLPQIGQSFRLVRNRCCCWFCCCIRLCWINNKRYLYGTLKRTACKICQFNGMRLHADLFIKVNFRMELRSQFDVSHPKQIRYAHKYDTHTLTHPLTVEHSLTHSHTRSPKETHAKIMARSSVKLMNEDEFKHRIFDRFGH